MMFSMLSKTVFENGAWSNDNEGPIFENCFMLSETRRTRNTGKHIWFSIFFCSEKHKESKKH